MTATEDLHIRYHVARQIILAELEAHTVEELDATRIVS